MKPWISGISKGLWLCYLSKDIIFNNGIANLKSFLESRALELATSLNKMLPSALAGNIFQHGQIAYSSESFK